MEEADAEAEAVAEGPVEVADRAGVAGTNRTAPAVDTRCPTQKELPATADRRVRVPRRKNMTPITFRNAFPTRGRMTGLVPVDTGDADTEVVGVAGGRVTAVDPMAAEAAARGA